MTRVNVLLVARGVPRWLSRGLCLLSLLAACGTAWLWWRTRHVVADEASANFGRCCVELVSTSAIDDYRVDQQLGVTVYYDRVGPPVYPDGLRSFRDPTDWIGHIPEIGDDRGLTERRTLGIHVVEGPVELYAVPDGSRLLLNRDTSKTHSIFVKPFWVRITMIETRHAIALVLFSAAPLAWFCIRGVRVVRAYRRKRDGLCVRCGYDLRGTPERCPECGNVVGT